MELVFAIGLPLLVLVLLANLGTLDEGLRGMWDAYVRMFRAVAQVVRRAS